MTLGLAEVTCPHLTKMQDITATDHKKAANAPHTSCGLAMTVLRNVGYQQKATSQKLTTSVTHGRTRRNHRILSAPDKRLDCAAAAMEQ